ncbi:MAG: hypothetical protein IGS03_10335 [Candidatus Sericytochromatia bacterium]|nr:hypothetical protein [Candidatus Sericytochromatia bacterium]
MAQNPAQDAFSTDKEALIPGLIGNFNIPKAVIENKIDVLAFLEIMVRKEIITANELDEIRAAVVAHLNAIYPQLELSYATPESMGQQAGLGGSALPQKPDAKASPPLYQPRSAPISKSATVPASQPGSGAQVNAPPPQFKVDNSQIKAALEKADQEGPVAQPAPAKPLWVQAPPPKFIK